MNEIEKKFFETFGIYLPYPYCIINVQRKKLLKCRECKGCYGVKYYPEITDRLLLELTRLIINEKCCELEYLFGIGYKDYSTFKYSIIATAIAYKNKIKQQVQALFKETSDE